MIICPGTVLTCLSIVIATSQAFLIGGCIGPRKAFERYLNRHQKAELAQVIEHQFDGHNKDLVMQSVIRFLKERLTVMQWETIQPEIEGYQHRNVPCSPYSQLLPPRYFKPLLQAVRRAVRMGADRSKIKYLVEDYLDRVLFTEDFSREYIHIPVANQKPLFPIVDLWRVLQPTHTHFYASDDETVYAKR